MSIEMIENDEFNAGTCIKVIGVGGGGGNAVNYMIERGVKGAEFISANTDGQALQKSKAPTVLQLGATGRGAGGNPASGREAAEKAVDEIRSAIRGANMLFISTGLGGGTGTGAAPVIAREARAMGMLTVGVVTKPFEWEGDDRVNIADEGLSELEANVDALVVVLNDKLEAAAVDESGEPLTLTYSQAFGMVNDVLRDAVGGIVEIITGYGEINVDFQDVCTVMSARGRAVMGTATASGPDRARIAAEKAIACPLLEGADLAGAKGVLLLLSGSRDTLSIKEGREASKVVRAYAQDDAKIKTGIAFNDDLGDEIRVTLLVTGLRGAEHAMRQPMTVMQGGLRNGTDGGVYGSALHGQSMGGHADTMGRPQVWGSSRADRADRSNAAARVDAMVSRGMEDYEIPAFLRKQAD